MSYEIYGFADLPKRTHAVLRFGCDWKFNSTRIVLGRCGSPNWISFRSSTWRGLVRVHGRRFKEIMNAEYILDYQDYDPHSDINLPINAAERLSLLVDSLPPHV